MLAKIIYIYLILNYSSQRNTWLHYTFIRLPQLPCKKWSWAWLGLVLDCGGEEGVCVRENMWCDRDHLLMDQMGLVRGMEVLSMPPIWEYEQLTNQHCHFLRWKNEVKTYGKYHKLRQIDRCKLINVCVCLFIQSECHFPINNIKSNGNRKHHFSGGKKYCCKLSY